MADSRKRPPGEALVDLRRRLSLLSPRDPGRTEIIARAADAYGISVWTMYRALRELNRPKSVRRADHGTTRIAPQAEMERYAEIVAALKIRTTNKKGRHVSTARAIEFLETDGVETPDGLVKVAPGLLKRATIDRLLRASGLDYGRVVRPSAAVRFQARRANELWHFDMSPSDLKQVEAPLWIEQGRGKPTLMLFSAVDDCSGVVYQEYRCVYGEDAESALRFLFNAFAAKPEPELPFQGLPVTIYMDNGPVSRSRVFQSVMTSLGIRALTHMPPKSDDRHTAARAKGKVERPFRTIKEVHETLYHFHKPRDEEEANLWIRRALVTYNNGDHRSEPHARIEHWLRHLPAEGVRAMCSWERFCAFAREPERRTVAGDATVSVEGASYEVEPELAGETVTLLWGLFDQQLFVEHDGKRYGPFEPSRGAVPLYRYRKYQKSRAEERLDKVVRLADQLGLPRATVTGGDRPLPSLPPSTASLIVRQTPFPDPVVETAFPTGLSARQAIAEQIRRPLGSLPEPDRVFIDTLLGETLDKTIIAGRIRERFQARRGDKLMLADVQSSYGLARPFQGAGNFETEHQRTIVREICAAVQTGRLVVVSGLVGSGKTHLLRRIEDELTRAGKVAVAKSLAVDKRRTSLPSLIEALFYDLSPGDRAQVKIPKQAERRERDLRDLMKKGKRPVVLVVDEAHDLHHKTLTGLKRLMEVVADAGVLLSVLLVGHPRLRNELRRPQMEEIGYRTTSFDYEGIGADRRDYVSWLLGACADEGVKVADLMEDDAIDLIADRLRTPLQIEMHLTLAFEHGFRVDARPVTVEIVEQVLSRAIDDLEPTLTRNGYDANALASQLNARPSDVRAFLAGTLDAERTQELTEQLRAAGVPL